MTTVVLIAMTNYGPALLIGSLALIFGIIILCNRKAIQNLLPAWLISEELRKSTMYKFHIINLGVICIVFFFMVMLMLLLDN